MSENRRDCRCKEIGGLLSQYIDAELSPEICLEIENHISGCAPCVEFVRSLRKSIELCREFREFELPNPLPRDARQQLEAAYRRMLESRRGA